MKLSPDRLLAGILEPVFAIRTEQDLGIGDTDGVRQMIDWCARLGLKHPHPRYYHDRHQQSAGDRRRRAGGQHR